MTLTRREFVATTSLALTGTLVRPYVANADVCMIVPTTSPLTPYAVLPDPKPVSYLHALAAAAIDAARGAGASYADVRVAEQHTVEPQEQSVLLLGTVGYGVRALVDGAWGFAYGRTCTPDGIAQCAEQAVTAARTSAQLMSARTNATQVDWTPPPPATGEWHSPMQIDPFTVPVQEQSELSNAIAWNISRVPDAEGAIVGPWVRETWVFAATTGALLTQYFCKAEKQGWIHVTCGGNRVVARVPGLSRQLAGYEFLLAPDLAERCLAGVDEVSRLARLPMRTMEVGRYPLVLDGYVMGALLSSVIGPSAELDRVLGYEGDAAGMSRWTIDLLGTVVASPLLTVLAHRKVPHINAVQWDSEGVVPREYPTLKEGVLVDYHTSVQTVAALKPWYARFGNAVQSNGTMASAAPDHPPSIRSPHLAMQPATSTASLEDLCHDIAHGVAVLYDGDIHTDQQLSSGTIDAGSMIFEIAQGKIVRRLKEMALQFNVMPLLKNLMAVGDIRTVRDADGGTSKGMPWQWMSHGATAPAVRFKEVNVTVTGRA